jgi:glutathione S-transferase
MSLWTPGGEVPVGPEGAPSEPAGGPDRGVTGRVGGPDLDALSPDERAQAEAMIAQMADVQRQILSAPAAQFVTNHVVGFYELAAIHLGQPQPDLDEARLAIDAMAAVLDAVEDRLGEDGSALRDALSQLQIVFVQVSAEVRAAGGEEATAPPPVTPEATGGDDADAAAHTDEP